MKKINKHIKLLLIAILVWSNFICCIPDIYALRPPSQFSTLQNETARASSLATVNNIPPGCEDFVSILKEIRDNYSLALSEQTLEEKVKRWQLAKEGLMQLSDAVSAAKENAELTSDKKVWLFTQLLEFSEAEYPDFLNGLASAMFTVDHNLTIAYLSYKIPDSSRFTYYLFLAIEYFERAFEKKYPEFSAAIAEKLQERLRKSQWPAVLTDKDIGEAIQAGSHGQLLDTLAQAGEYYLTTPQVQDAFKLYYPELSDADRTVKLQGAFIRAIEVFVKVPRHLFLPRFAEPWAGYDMPLFIPYGHGQTISQPSFVYLITALVNPNKTDRVCEIGVGSGYQTAILAELTNRVVAVDIYPDLVASAAQATSRLRLKNIDFFVGDGSQGLPEQGPFDIIVVSAGGTEAAAQVLEKQLALGGRLIMPILSPEPNRDLPYDLMLRVRTTSGITQIAITPSAWVPLVGAKGRSNEAIDTGAQLGKPMLFTASSAAQGSLPMSSTSAISGHNMPSSDL